jgi:hypothetical protein
MNLAPREIAALGVLALAVFEYEFRFQICGAIYRAFLPGVRIPETDGELLAATLPQLLFVAMFAIWVWTGSEIRDSGAHGSVLSSASRHASGLAASIIIVTMGCPTFFVIGGTLAAVAWSFQ